MRCRYLSSLFFALLVSAPLAAPAQAPVRVDFHQGPIISAGRVIGMGGAFLAIAEGADSQLVNPVAYTMRSPHTVNEWFDWDVALSWFDISARDDIDLDQSGRAAFESARLLQFGFNLKFGRHGFGLFLAQQAYTIEDETTDDDTRLIYGQIQPSLGYAYAEDDWSWGVAVAGSDAQIARPDQDPLARITGAGLLLGAVYHPQNSPWRIGATWRTTSVGAEREGDPDTAAEQLPEEIVLPWEVGVGVAHMWGDRIFNPRRSYGAGKPGDTGGRRYIMASADVLLTGGTDNAISAQEFLDADAQPQDLPASLSVRMGVESEVIADRLQVRAGTYYEPARPDPWGGRWHGTAGADVALEWGWRWKIGTVLDVAPDYLNFGLGVGLWH